MANKSTKLAGYGKRMGTLLDRMAPHQADWGKLCQEITKAGFSDGRCTFEVNVQQDVAVTYAYDLAVAGDRMNGTFRLSVAQSDFKAVAVRRMRWAEPFELFSKELKLFGVFMGSNDEMRQIVDAAARGHPRRAASCRDHLGSGSGRWRHGASCGDGRAFHHLPGSRVGF